MLIAAMLAVAVQAGADARCLAAIDHGGFVKSQLLDCATAEMDRADAALNARYRAVMARLPAARRARLRDDERGWIDRRRATCLAALREALPSPEINRMRCLVRETDARTAYLRAIR